MRILIGYDNCECSEAVVTDLCYAGLGSGISKSVEARVVSVACVSDLLEDQEYVRRHPNASELIYEREQPRIDAAAVAAGAGAQQLHALRPGWCLTSEVLCGQPVHQALIEAAERWPADLLVVGSHGRGTLGRLIQGSVDQVCVNQCQRSVRVARRPRQEAGDAEPGRERPVKLILAIDGSVEGDAALREVARRHWPRQSHAWVVTVVEPTLAYAGRRPEINVLQTQARRIADDAARALEAAGLSASPVVLEGEPARMIVSEADREGVDCIFLGARGHGAMERLFLGSVASAVAANATCSVEVVRPTCGAVGAAPVVVPAEGFAGPSESRGSTLPRSCLSSDSHATTPCLISWIGHSREPPPSGLSPRLRTPQVPGRPITPA